MADAAAKYGRELIQPEVAQIGMQGIHHQSADNDQQQDNTQHGHDDAASAFGDHLRFEIVHLALVVLADLRHGFGIFLRGAGRLAQTVAREGGQQRLIRGS